MGEHEEQPAWVAALATVDGMVRVLECVAVLRASVVVPGA